MIGVKVSNQERKIRRQRKTDALNRIGGAKCVICGCVEIDMLTFDHADKNGSKHRKEIGKSEQSMPGWVLKASKAKIRKWNLRCLCANCNLATVYCTDNEVKKAVARERKRIRK